jgi:hypothetical protein
MLYETSISWYTHAGSCMFSFCYVRETHSRVVGDVSQELRFDMIA